MDGKIPECRKINYKDSSNILKRLSYGVSRLDKTQRGERKVYNYATNTYKALTYWRGGLCVNPEKGFK